jgi:hypothetical protein
MRFELQKIFILFRQFRTCMPQLILPIVVQTGPFLGFNLLNIFVRFNFVVHNSCLISLITIVDINLTSRLHHIFHPRHITVRNSSNFKSAVIVIKKLFRVSSFGIFISGDCVLKCARTERLSKRIVPRFGSILVIVSVGISLT